LPELARNEAKAMSDSEPISKSLFDLGSRFKIVNLTDLKLSPHNARKHTKAHARAIARSFQAFGFIAPILADKGGNVIAGHGRMMAAELLGLTQVPVWARN
jgi:ParB-like chromosome segregation protein Spo0J